MSILATYDLVQLWSPTSKLENTPPSHVPFAFIIDKRCKNSLLAEINEVCKNTALAWKLFDKSVPSLNFIARVFPQRMALIPLLNLWKICSPT